MTTTVLRVEESAPPWNTRDTVPEAIVPSPEGHAWPSPATSPPSGAPGKPPTAQAVVSSKGQVTLPAAMRAQLGLGPGSAIRFELRGRELVIKPELPISAYRGMLKGYDLGDIEPEKEPDREFG